MDIKDISDITSNWSEFAKLEESVASSKISELWKSGLKAASEKFENDIKQKDQSLSEAQAKIEKALAELEQVKAAQIQAQTELEQIKASQKAVQDQEAYSSRMSELEDEYDLDDEDRKCIAAEIMGMCDESYSAFKNKFASLAKYKSKKYKAQMEEEVRAKCMKEAQAALQTSTASTKSKEDLAVEALASASTKEFVPSAHVVTQTSVLDQYASAFSTSSVKFSYRK